MRVLGRVVRAVFLSPVFLGLVGAVVGVLVFGATVGRPKIGVIDVPFTILFSGTVQDLAEKLQYARDRSDIKAVVIRLTSPGGTVSASEEFFLQMSELRQKKPVVVAVDSFALSGGYMGIMGANYIYVKPSSFVGNVGAILFLPRDLGRPFEEIVPTGPFKAEGASYRLYINMLEQVKETFAAIVFSQRGDRLRIPREEVLTGRLFLGTEAVRAGLADAIGTDADAIRKAAELAGVRFYSLVDVNAEVAKLRGQQGFFFGSEPRSYTSVQEFMASPDFPRFPYVYYLYVEPW